MISRRHAAYGCRHRSRRNFTIDITDDTLYNDVGLYFANKEDFGMLLAVDIGNSSVKFGLFDNSSENLVASFSISSLTVRSADEYALCIKSFLRDRFDESLPEIDAAVISSVVPHICSVVCKALEQICKNKPFIIGTGTKTGFPIHIDIQSQLGADIVSNTAAAFAVCRPPFVIVDAGTATTVTYVDENGALDGTVIAPGIATSLSALVTSAALLPDAPLTKPGALIGKNSRDSVLSGAYFGAVYAIDGFIRNIREQMRTESPLGLIGTGGMSSVLADCRNKFTVIPELTLKGAAVLYFHNRQ